MKIAAGKKSYSAGTPPVKAEGFTFSQAELDFALEQRLPPLLRDDAGKKNVDDYLGGLAKTAFASDKLAAALNVIHPVRDWQVGEAFAEAYLADHRDCEFPWPTGRDLRNPNASPAGADLVGFQKHGPTRRFAFGEVKTSEEDKSPPQVVTGRHGLANQLEVLRDSDETKHHLVILYLGHRASSSSWEKNYRESVTRYLKDPSDISLFGFLVRDIAPNVADLQSRAKALAKGCPKETSIELNAVYLPPKSIRSLATKARLKRGGSK
jgi:hypothetical protein